MDDSLNGTIIVIAILIILVIYFAPSFIAFSRGHHYRWVILCINIVLGASGIGYLVAFVWAVWPQRTAFADVFVNDPTTNSVAANQTIYSRYGANANAFHSPTLAKTAFVFSRNQRFGPYTIAEIQSFLATGQFSPSDLIWIEGNEEWKPISTLNSAPPPPPH